MCISVQKGSSVILLLVHEMLKRSNPKCTSQQIYPSLYILKKRNFSISGGKISTDIGGNSLDFTLSQFQGSRHDSSLTAGHCPAHSPAPSLTSTQCVKDKPHPRTSAHEHMLRDTAYTYCFHKVKKRGGGFLGGSVVKNLPANAGDTGSIPGPGRSHVPWGN